MTDLRKAANVALSPIHPGTKQGHDIRLPLPPSSSPPRDEAPSLHFSRRKEGGAQHSAPFSIGAQVRAEEESPGSAADVLVIVSVVPGGACDRAGVRAGDELVEVGRDTRVVYDRGAKIILFACDELAEEESIAACRVLWSRA